MGLGLASAAVGIVFSCGLVLFARYLLRRSEQGLSLWPFGNGRARSRFYRGLQKFSFTFMLFLGVYEAALVILQLASSTPILFFIAVPVALMGTWLLIPRAVDIQIIGANRGNLLSTWLPIAKLSRSQKFNALGVAAVWLVFLISIFTALGRSEACRLAFDRARSDALVIKTTGSPLKRAVLIEGNFQTSGSSGSADLTIPVSGPAGSGELYVSAVEREGAWNLTTLQFAKRGDNHRYDLLVPTSDGTRLTQSPE